MTTDDILKLARARRALRTPSLLRERRAALEISQTEVAEVLGVTRSAVSLWERGERTPRGMLAHRYVELLAWLEADQRGTGVT